MYLVCVHTSECADRELRPMHAFSLYMLEQHNVKWGDLSSNSVCCESRGPDFKYPASMQAVDGWRMSVPLVWGDRDGQTLQSSLARQPSWASQGAFALSNKMESCVEETPNVLFWLCMHMYLHTHVCTRSHTPHMYACIYWYVHGEFFSFKIWVVEKIM